MGGRGKRLGLSFHRKGAKKAKGLVFLFFAERPKNKKSIPSERQNFSFAILPAP
jgi:hypothetical protein